MSKSMNTRTRYVTLAALALAGGLVGAAYASSDEGKDTYRRTDPAMTAASAGTSAPPFALDEVLARSRTAGHSDFREIERENGRQEVKGGNLYGGARTAEVVEQEHDD